MGKFPIQQNLAKNRPNDLENNTNEINWQQLLIDYQYLSVEDALKNIMNKVSSLENIEFDQICLILKHYLLLENNNSYLNHFVQFNDAEYLNRLVDRFSQSSLKPNIQWMLSELFKLLSSIFTIEQTDFVLIKSEKFRNLLLNDAFSTTILEKSKIPFGLTLTERTVISNIFDTISNLWYSYFKSKYYKLFSLN
jgi:hypothetical protein